MVTRKEIEPNMRSSPIRRSFMAAFCFLFGLPVNADDRPQCKHEALQSFRREIETQFRKDPNSSAVEKMEGRWNSCQYDFSESVDVQWLASDLALYLSKTNRKRDCKSYFCAPKSYVDCDRSRQKQPWDKAPSRAEKALMLNIDKCLKTSETGIDDVQLVNEYRTQKTSALPICQNKAFRYLRFHPEKNDLGEVVGTFIQNADSAKLAAVLSEDEQMSPPFLVWAGDINGDGLNDLLLNNGGCGSRADCVYQLYANCGKGRYAALLDDTQYANDMRVGSGHSIVTGTRWRNLNATFRHSDASLGCDQHIGDFGTSVQFTFDGKKYVLTDAEMTRNRKEVEARRNGIRQACLNSN